MIRRLFLKSILAGLFPVAATIDDLLASPLPAPKTLNVKINAITVTVSLDANALADEIYARLRMMPLTRASLTTAVNAACADIGRFATVTAKPEPIPCTQADRDHFKFLSPDGD